MLHKLLNTLLLIVVLLACNSQSYKTVNEIDNPLYRTALRFDKSKVWFYDASYYSIPYPNGDVPGGGACTDVVIRVLRANHIDLQREVHEDMLANFSSYPNKWGLSKPDPNIDHRRVPNLMVYFERHGWKADDTWKSGDIVCWELSPGVTHIGIFMTDESVYHNIGFMARIEKNFLFKYRIIGHYRLKQKTSI